MRCPACQHEDSRVVDSRETEGGDTIRRRRSCQACNHRFSTVERVEQKVPWIVKKDGHREAFDRDKVLRGMALACRKRPVSAETLEIAAARVEQSLVELRENEVPSTQLGGIVLAILREVDAVAWVRFASVYQAFDSPEQFGELIRGAE
ncbi:MAG: transcriptional repressor NrdR [Alphaproteobacteria bacterium]|nr:transcriptional repressor NrdR [Alphaproteobacteria bacterium]MCB9699714.1 transcriptional repressor NrdR [Alphaproteobacteria bacterium]